MWDMVGIIAAVVVIMLVLEALDVSESLRGRLRGTSDADRIRRIEQRVSALEKKLS